MIIEMLRSYVAMYVPSTKNVNEPADTRNYCAKVRMQFSNWFGGTTTTEVQGDYTLCAGGNVPEKIMVVKSFCTTEQLEEYFPRVIELGDWLCRELEQETVAVEVNNQMIFLDGK